MNYAADKTERWFVDSTGTITQSESWVSDFIGGQDTFDTERAARENALRKLSDLRDKYANLAVTHARWILEDDRRKEEEKKALKVGDRVRDDDGDTGTVIAISERAKEIIVEIDDDQAPWTYSYPMDSKRLEKIED